MDLEQLIEYNKKMQHTLQTRFNETITFHLGLKGSEIRPYSGNVHYNVACNPMPMPCDLERTIKAIKKSSKTEFVIPTTFGPGMWMDRKYKITLTILKLFKTMPNKKLTIYTLSDLFAHNDYSELLTPNVTIIFCDPTKGNEELRNKLYPGSPSVNRLIKARKTLSKPNIHTKWSYEPIKTNKRGIKINKTPGYKPLINNIDYIIDNSPNIIRLPIRRAS